MFYVVNYRTSQNATFFDYIHFAGNLEYSIHRSREHDPLRTVGAVRTDQSPAALALDGLVVAVSRGVDKSRAPER